MAHDSYRHFSQDPSLGDAFFRLMRWSDAAASGNDFNVGYYASALKTSGAASVTKTIASLQNQMIGMVWDTVFRWKGPALLSQRLTV